MGVTLENKGFNELLVKSKKIASEMKKANEVTVRVGLLDTNLKYPNGEGVVDVGIQHEFGINNPKRSFLQIPLNKYSQEILETIKSQVDIEKLDINLVANEVGIKAVAIVNKWFITSGEGSWQPNTQETIKEKGSDKPLIDTGKLRQSIVYKVE